MAAQDYDILPVQEVNGSVIQQRTIHPENVTRRTLGCITLYWGSYFYHKALLGILKNPNPRFVQTPTINLKSETVKFVDGILIEYE